MITRFRKVTLIRVKRPKKSSLNEELQWFSHSLGLFSSRDKEKSCFRIFLELLKSTKKGKGLTSDEIAEKSHLSRGTVIYHINRLAEQGFVIIEDGKYKLRVDNLGELVRLIQQDLKSIFKELKDMAEELDKELKNY